MSELQYLAQDGRVLYHSETNRHHCLWRGDWYTNTAEKKFRNMSGLVLRMTIGMHSELHQAVEPPHKPNQDLARDIYRFGRNVESTDPYVIFSEILDYLYVVELADTPNSLDASRLVDSFTAQQVFIDAGRVALHRGAYE